jgi:SAM-dependent methyltransferase
MTTQCIRTRLVRLVKPKFAKLTAIGTSPRRILDIGIANDSYLECKAVFPAATYHGLDVVDAGVAMIAGDKFLLRNLEDPHALDDLEPSYDVIIANHVLEHLERGQEVFAQLCRLLAPQGLLYVEVPSLRTAFRAKRGGNYHFHDDPTHRTFYRLEDLANTAIRADCRVVSCGPASTWLKDLLSFPRAVIGMARRDGWGPYLLHLQRKIDHILIQRQPTHPE